MGPGPGLVALGKLVFCAHVNRTSKNRDTHTKQIRSKYEANTRHIDVAAARVDAPNALLTAVSITAVTVSPAVTAVTSGGGEGRSGEGGGGEGVGGEGAGGEGGGGEGGGGEGPGP